MLWGQVVYLLQEALSASPCLGLHTRALGCRVHPFPALGPAGDMVAQGLCPLPQTLPQTLPPPLGNASSLIV